MERVLNEGPRFITRNFLTIQKWEPSFIPKEVSLTHSAIWAWLPQLPTEFYDQQILEKIDGKLGTLLKIDTCTSTTLREKYVHICVQVPLEHPLKTHVTIGTHRQMVIYEGETILCTNCSMLGHTYRECTSTMKSTNTDTPSTSEAVQPSTNTQ
ncbi:hypothetical protein FXO38_36134 [Capsicum annuum]|nr:hypothetical protein FXO38_36134 [Capsicum annuum]KAF3621113.1 hypothetical protein FXO37_32976 [Capsicum annuum]